MAELSQERTRWREASRRYRAANPEKKRDGDRRYKRAHPERSRLVRHGLRLEELAAFLEVSECYLCGDPLPAATKARIIDHDHRCCRQPKSCRYCRRGVACGRCNTLIGLALDDPQRLRRIADNLEAAIADVTRRLADKPLQAELFRAAEESA